MLDRDEGSRVPDALINIQALRIPVLCLLEIAFEPSDFSECVNRGSDALLAFEFGLDRQALFPPRLCLLVVS